MRKLILSAIAVAVFCFLCMAASGARTMRLRASLREAAAADENRSIVVGDLTRNYLLHVPKLLPSSGKAPLVLVLHGGGGRDWNMPGFTHFDDLADEEGFFVAYPDSYNRNWNDTRGMSTADDVAFIRALIDELARSHPIDSRRVYATGISNGGFFSNRLACDLTDKIGAIASIAATMPETLVPVCKPSRPISVMFIQGTKDPLVPINGGNIGFQLGRSRGQNISLADAVKFWRTQDRISSQPIEENLPDHVDDGTHVRRETWSGGKDNTEVIVYTVEGGGHTWPGGPQYLPKLIVGVASQNLDATHAIWEFFKKHFLGI